VNRSSSVAPLVLLALTAITAPAEAKTKSYALVIGNNAPPEEDARHLPALRYADDDAARYLDLFRLLGARTYLLARVDDNTRRLHPQAAAEAAPPIRAELDRVAAQVAADVARARLAFRQTWHQHKFRQTPGNPRPRA